MRVSRIESNLNKRNKLQLYFKNENKTYTFPETSGSIGRDKSCFIRINDNQISRIHCDIIYLEAGYFLEDKNSINGTYILIQPGVEYYAQKGSIFLMGTSLYEIISINKNCDEVEIAAFTKDVETADTITKYYLKLNCVLFGKKEHCHIKLPDEENVDDLHAVLESKADKITIRTLSSPYFFFG